VSEYKSRDNLRMKSKSIGVFFALVLVLLSATSVLAQGVTLFGNMGCRDWLGSDSSTRSAYRYWLSGYISATNSFYVGMVPPELAQQVDFLRGRNFPEIEEMLERHCSSNPVVSLQEASVAVISILQKERLGN
jgi:hypothetical protein